MRDKATFKPYNDVAKRNINSDRKIAPQSAILHTQSLVPNFLETTSPTSVFVSSKMVLIDEKAIITRIIAIPQGHDKSSKIELDPTLGKKIREANSKTGSNMSPFAKLGTFPKYLYWTYVVAFEYSTQSITEFAKELILCDLL